jgi:hypothetical protein
MEAMNSHTAADALACSKSFARCRLRFSHTKRPRKPNAAVDVIKQRAICLGDDMTLSTLHFLASVIDGYVATVGRFNTLGSGFIN